MRTLEEYLSLPYHDRIVRSETTTGEPSWFGTVDELLGLTTSSLTLDDMEAQLEEAKRAWIETALEDGIEIPEPREDVWSIREYSGRLGIRVPKGLHRDLAERADLEGVSLNSLIQSLLAGGVAWGSASAKQPLGIGELSRGKEAGFDARALVYGATLADEMRHAREDLGVPYNAESESTDAAGEPKGRSQDR